MATAIHITAWCSIRDNSIVKNNIEQFEISGVSISEFVIAAYKHLNVQYPKFYKMDNLSKLGWLATEGLLNGFDKGKYAAEDVAVILCNANASLDSDIRYLVSVQDAASPALFVYTLPNIVIGEICIRHGFKGENAFFITPQFDAELLCRQVNETIAAGAAACICGWVDVLGGRHRATLFLAEKAQAGDGVLFSANNLRKIFDSN